MTDERPLFLHPPWMVGIMLILGVVSLIVGLTVDPFWLAMGSPAILTLCVYLGARVALSLRMRRPPTARPDADRDDRRSADDREPVARGRSHDTDHDGDSR